MFEVKSIKPYGKIYNEIATFSEFNYAQLFADALKDKMYDVIEIHSEGEIVYKSK